MTLIDPNGWRPLAKQLVDLLREGQPLGEALRSVAVSSDAGALLLFKAVQNACQLSSREAAKIVAREVTANKL